MDHEKGYVIRYRSIYDWYQENNLDIYCLSIYDYLSTFVSINDTSYRGFDIKKNQLIRSYNQIAKALKISRRQVINKMSQLKAAGAIDYHQIYKNGANIITVNDVIESKEDENDKNENVNLDDLIAKLD